MIEISDISKDQILTEINNEKKIKDFINMNDYQQIKIIENFSLKPFNTFNLNVFTKYFVTIKNENEIRLILQDKKFNNIKKLILGGGSNILFIDNFDGLIMKVEILGIEKLKETSQYIYLKIGSGVLWHDLVEYCIKNKYYGIENLSLIPGTVGGAPIQNIGAYGTEFKEVFQSLEAINLLTGEKKNFLKKECFFGYRDSIFKNKLKYQYLITNILLKLPKTQGVKLKYFSLKEEIDKLKIKNPSLRTVSDIIIKMRRDKFPVSEVMGNAGSFFKNPLIDTEDFKILKNKFPKIKGYKSKNKIKVSAGWLIEAAGWRGIKMKNVGTLKNHALVIVNYGNANGLEILNFAKKIYLAVKAKFKIELIPEVNIIISDLLKKDFEKNILKYEKDRV